MNLTSFAVLLNVEDVTRSIAFYRDHLGFSVSQKAENDGRVHWALLEVPGVRLMLNETHDVDSRGRRNRREYEDAVFYFTIADVDLLHEKLNDSGVEVGSLADEDYGNREFYIRDPDGYELGFGSPIN